MLGRKEKVEGEGTVRKNKLNGGSGGFWLVGNFAKGYGRTTTYSASLKVFESLHATHS